MDHTLFQLHSSEMLAHSYLPLDYPSLTPDGLTLYVPSTPSTHAVIRTLTPATPAIWPALSAPYDD